MALTAEQEAKVLQLIEAFENGKRVEDLPTQIIGEDEELVVEVKDTDDESKQLELGVLLNKLVKLASPTTQELNTNLALKTFIDPETEQVRGFQLRGTALDGTEHPIIELARDGNIEQIKIGSETIHINLNNLGGEGLDNHITCDTKDDDGNAVKMSVAWLSDVIQQATTALQNSKTYTDTEIAYALSKVNHFIGFMSSTTPPQGIARESNLWYASDNLPTSFPIQVKTFTDGAWSSGTSAYTPDQFDLWAKLSNNKGYYWFGNVWNIQDLETDEDTIDLTEEGLAYVKDQTFTITEQTSKFANNAQTSFKGFWQGVMGKINGIITSISIV